MSYAFTPITFVFRPGGVATGNIFTTWASLYNILKNAAGPKQLQVDSSLAPALVDVGTFDLADTTIIGASQNLVVTSQLTLPDGAILQDPAGISDQLILETQGTTTPSLLFTSGGTFGIENGSRINNTGTQPCTRLSAANQFVDFAFLYGGSFNSTGAALIDMPVAPAQTILVGLAAGNFGGLDNVVTGVVGTTLNIVFDAGIGHLPTNPGFAGSSGPSAVDQSQFVQYGPAVPADWATPPTEVAQALDELAARSGGSAPQETEFLVSTTNIFSALPATGTMIVDAFGVGGGGGGGGGEGGSVATATPGVGAGGGGGALPSSQTFTVDLSHQIDVHVGDGGLGGVGGAGATSGLNGSDGQTTYIVDVTDNITLASFSGASGGQGGQATSSSGGSGGASMFGQQFLPSSTGFLAAGGSGGAASTGGLFGQPNQLGCGQPFAGGGPSEGLFSGGPPGLVGAPPNDGGTGGGGGAGVFEGGGAGGGADALANSGAGGGGGTGGSSVGGNGTNGAAGGSGRLRVKFFAP